MWKFAIALFLLPVLNAEVRSVCLNDRVGLNQFTRHAFETETRDLFPQLTITFERCAGPAISVSIAAYPPARYANALGLTQRSGNRVYPQIEVYTGAVRRVIGEHASAASFGRALARVAAHELRHYLLQQLHHEDQGLMRVSFGPAHLTSERWDISATHSSR